MFLKPIIIATVVFSTGCATVTQGTSQHITVKTKAPCSVKRDGVEFATVTPEIQKIGVSKAKTPIIVSCEGKPDMTIESKATKTAMAGAVLLDGGIIDMLTGAFWMYPLEVEVE